MYLKFQFRKGGKANCSQPFLTGLSKASNTSSFNSNKKNNNNDTNQLKPELILQELNSLIGLSEVKNLISEIHAYVQIQKRREKEKLCTDPLVLHMIFKGNPLITPVKILP